MKIRIRVPEGVGLWGLLILVALPLFLRLSPIQHGQPDGYLPDTHVVNNALGMAKDKNLAPLPGQYSSYPNAIPYMLLPIYGAQYALGKMSGEWNGTQEYGATLLEDPWRAHLPARILCALLASLAPAFVFFGLRRCGLGKGALWGAFFMATCLLHVHYSTHERPWAPLTAAMCATGWAAAAFVDSRRYGYLVLSGALAGLSVAMHPGGLPASLIPAIAWFVVGIPWRGADLKSRLFWGHACAGAFLVIGLLLGYPHLLLSGGQESGTVVMEQAIQDKAHLSLGGQAVVFGFRMETLKRLSAVFLGYDPAIILLGLLGLLISMANKAARPMVLFALLVGAVFLTNVNDHVRYILPLAAGLTWCAGFASEYLDRFKAGRVLLFGLAGLSLVQALRLDFVLRQEDTRHQIEAALFALPDGSDVAIGLNGPEIALDAPSLERISGLRELYRREANLLARLQAGTAQGKFLGALPLQDVIGIDQRHHSTLIKDKAQTLYGNDINLALERAGITHVLLVDTTPGDPRTPLLLDSLPPDSATGIHLSERNSEGVLPKLAPLQLLGPALTQVHPGRGDHLPSSARLPQVMDFPLRDLWTVKRPGPVLTLHELRNGQ